jgi:hypothetical protein
VMSELEHIIGNSSFPCQRAGQRLSRPKRRNIRVRPHRFSTLCLIVFLLGTPSWSQEGSEERDALMPSKQLSQQRIEEQLKVNFIYGAYVPKDVPLVSLTRHQRAHLFVLQTFTTPGIYVKTTFLALVNQASGTPYEWGGALKASDAVRLPVTRDLRCRMSFRRPEMRYSNTNHAMTAVAAPASAPEQSTLSCGTSSLITRPKRICVRRLRSTDLRLGLGCCPASGCRMTSPGRMASAGCRGSNWVRHGVQLDRGIRARNRAQIKATHTSASTPIRDGFRLGGTPV